MKKLRLSTIIVVVVAMLLSSVVMVFAQDNDVAPESATGVVPPKGPSIANSPVGGGTLLYDNGPLVNSAGTGSGGADEAVLQNNSLGLNILGFGHQIANNNRIADDFTVTQSGGWNVSTITVYAYQTNGGIPSTITGINMQIWDGDPSDVASTVIWGDDTTNVLAATGWSGVYRVTEDTTGTATNRAIMTVTVDVNSFLPAGSYWVDWSVDGSAASGPWAPPININGTGVTGNGLQSLAGTWGAALDSGTTDQQGFPFMIEGALAAPTDVSFAGFSGNAASNNMPIVIGLLVLTVLAGAIVVRRQMVR